MAAGREITLRLTIVDPVPGVAYSLQKDDKPLDVRVAAEAPLSWDVPVRVADGPRFLGDFVRREGPVRRFVYIRIGTAAGDPLSPWSRRAKIDIHTLPPALLEKAFEGAVLETRLPGKGKDGSPACATVRPLEAWRAV